MPVHLPNLGRLGVKVATVVPDNPERGLPTTQALLVVLDAKTGRTEAVMDGEALTAVRTGAASGLATDLLARGVAWRPIVKVALTGIPDTLVFSLPLSALIGTLLIFGRLSADG